MLAPRWAVTMSPSLLEVSTERAAETNSEDRPWPASAIVPSRLSDCWMPANALPSTEAASPVRSCRSTRS